MESEEGQSELPPRDGRILDAWLKDLTFERDLSAHSRTAYASDLTHLARFLLTQTLSLAEAGADHLIAFLHQRQELGDGATTRARRLAAMRSFYRWLKDTGRSTHNPSLLLPRGKKPELLPKSLGASETERLIAALPQGDDPGALRDRAVIELLYGAGLRASEATGLGQRDFDERTALLRVLGKGRRERRVPLGTPGVAALLRWMHLGRPKLVNPRSDEALFLSNKGSRLTRQAVYEIVRALSVKAGLPKGTSPHTLRHTFATHLVHGGADLRAVQELLGHASINTTQIYTHLLQNHLLDTHRRFHPRG